MEVLIVAMAIASVLGYGTKRAITDTYCAVKGKDTPSLAKWKARKAHAAARRAEKAAAKEAREPGPFRGWFSDVWGDWWQRRAEKHRANEAARQANGGVLPGTARGWLYQEASQRWHQAWEKQIAKQEDRLAAKRDDMAEEIAQKRRYELDTKLADHFDQAKTVIEPDPAQAEEPKLSPESRGRDGQASDWSPFDNTPSDGPGREAANPPEPLEAKLRPESEREAEPPSRKESMTQPRQQPPITGTGREDSEDAKENTDGQDTSDSEIVGVAEAVRPTVEGWPKRFSDVERANGRKWLADPSAMIEAFNDGSFQRVIGTTTHPTGRGLLSTMTWAHQMAIKAGELGSAIDKALADLKDGEVDGPAVKALQDARKAASQMVGWFLECRHSLAEQMVLSEMFRANEESGSKQFLVSQ